MRKLSAFNCQIEIDIDSARQFDPHTRIKKGVTMRSWILLALLFTGTAHAKLVTFEMNGVTGCWLSGCFGFGDATGLPSQPSGNPLQPWYDVSFRFTVDDEVGPRAVLPGESTYYDFSTGLTLTIGSFSTYFENFTLQLMRRTVFAEDVILLSARNTDFGIRAATIGACSGRCDPAFNQFGVFTDYLLSELIAAPMERFRYFAADDTWGGNGFQMDGVNHSLRIVPEPSAWALFLLAIAAAIVTRRSSAITSR